MTAPIATARSVPEMIAAYQIRMQQLQVTGAELERAIPLGTGHISQLFKARPTKNMGGQTFENINTQLGVMWVMVENPETAEKYARGDGRFALCKAASPGMLAIGRQQVTTIKITRRKLKKMAKAGGHARAAKLSARKRSNIARKAANARWHPAPPPQQLPRSGLPVSGPAHLTNAERRGLLSPKP